MEFEQPTSAIVSCQWLKRQLDNPKLVLIDALMNTVIGIDALHYETNQMIPGALCVDVEQDLCDLNSSQLHAMPTTKQFNALMVKLNISKDATVVIYDQQGVYSSPRVWWTFKYMGFDNVFVLNGGLPHWLAQGYEVDNHYRQASPVGDVKAGDIIVARKQTHRVATAQSILSRLKDDNLILLDARSRARFNAEVAEPRAGVRAGHIPGSSCLPFIELLSQRCLLPVEQLQRQYQQMIDSADERVLYSCGSGITACILILAADVAGYHNACLYDGSWAEWGSDSKLPIQS
ncbi:sulfurtransferase [Thalassotalea sp. HSM 43]|uniref:sulfurtransferase n=1 Tax=Thalassotalea sp. HSM 43 TaxID=2552945 RepID=UPI001081EF20|nr:sulfurtransferase [Thalassotalea sp. HSM 43]QBY02863.1 sulfurtransferase [Thalassotalea sp. HSM 43]